MDIAIIIIIIILLIIVIAIPLFTRRREKKLIWKNEKPIQRYMDLIDEFGNPNILNKSMAI